jgi:hypothetical protein
MKRRKEKGATYETLLSFSLAILSIGDVPFLPRNPVDPLIL